MANQTQRHSLFLWFTRFASAGVASATSELIYRLFLVPRLLNFYSVPIYWWLLVFSPVILVFLLLLVLRPADWLAVAISVALGVATALVVIDARRGSAGLPVSHDVFFGTREYLFDTIYRTALLLALFAFVSWPTSFVINFVRKRWRAA
ncbi:MAG TPA: hypothetical protein VER58_16300 [Thermoanaerobaculia bacterium]|nr:hypothetical protein [Thermoanaerobaculia bacterium]